MGVAPSASAVSRLNQTLTEQFEAWRERSLLSHYRILYLDGALGVDLEGNKDVLARRPCAEEDKDGWSCLVQDLRRRGATQMDLIVTDGHDGLLAAVASLFPVTLRQRCLMHKQRNMMNAVDYLINCGCFSDNLAPFCWLHSKRPVPHYVREILTMFDPSMSTQM